MLEAIEYLERDDGICICRCYGEGGYLSLPDRIGDRPVTALADHVFAREPSFALRGVPKKKAVKRDDRYEPERTAPGGGAGGEDDLFMPERALKAEQLTDIVLPSSVRRIGDYAFYGCRNLRRVTMGSRMENLGGGAFVASNHIRELIFTVDAPQGEDPGPLPAIRQVLLEISYEVEVRICTPDGKDYLRLRFPEYYEDAIENTPARIFEMKFEGTGFKYRQCFKDDRPDLARYDSLFYEASVQEFPPTVFAMIFDRLIWPRALGPQEKAQYLSYVEADPGRFTRWCFSARDRDADTSPDALLIMQTLCREDFFTRESLQTCIAAAVERERADVVSLLRDYKREHFPQVRAAGRYLL